MSNRIKSIGALWQGSDGQQRTRFRGPHVDLIEESKKILSLPEPRTQLENFLILDDDSRVVLPVNEIPYLLPDRTGVLIIFDPDSKPEKFPSEWPNIEPPHNAVLLNADGSLRFRLSSPAGVGSYIGAVHTYPLSADSDPNPVNLFGVLIGEAGHQPEWFYELDPHQPELKVTGKWVRY